MKATSFSSSISANLGNSGEAMVEIHKYSVKRNLWPPHFRTFCELVEGEENKLTTFSTWTIMLGCNESNIIFQQHLCKLGQLRRSNGRNSQVLYTVLFVCWWLFVVYVAHDDTETGFCLCTLTSTHVRCAKNSHVR